MVAPAGPLILVIAYCPHFVSRRYAVIVIPIACL